MNPVRANAAALAERVPGLRLETIPVTADGVVDLEALRVMLREGKGRTLIALMAANNETGVVQPVAGAAELGREAKLSCSSMRCRQPERSRRLGQIMFRFRRIRSADRKARAL